MEIMSQKHLQWRERGGVGCHLSSSLTSYNNVVKILKEIYGIDRNISPDKGEES